MKQRLHKILAQATELSRRTAEEVIARGEVSVNGVVVTKLGSLADPGLDDIRWKGRRIHPLGAIVYIRYNKPKNKLVTKKDLLGRPTIWSDLKGLQDRVNSVGRLDYDSEGLLILTNDGELVNRLTHPKYHISKTYNVKVRGFPSDAALEELRKGITYKGIVYSGARVKIKSKTEKHTWVDVTIAEGKNRQIRNMFFAINHPVLKLKRIAIGPVRLGQLEVGEWRYLNKREVMALLLEAGLKTRR